MYEGVFICLFLYTGFTFFLGSGDSWALHHFFLSFLSFSAHTNQGPIIFSFNCGELPIKEWTSGDTWDLGEGGWNCCPKPTCPISSPPVSENRVGEMRCCFSKNLSPSGCTSPTLEIASTECIGQVWDAKESLAIWLMNWPPNTQADALHDLLKAVSGWAMKYLRQLILGDFHVHADEVASSQAKDLASSTDALGLSRFILIPMDQTDHTLTGYDFWNGDNYGCGPDCICKVLSKSDHSVEQSKAAPPVGQNPKVPWPPGIVPHIYIVRMQW